METKRQREYMIERERETETQRETEKDRPTEKTDRQTERTRTRKLYKICGLDTLRHVLQLVLPKLQQI